MTDTDQTRFEAQLRSGLAQEADRLHISAGLTERAHARIDGRQRHPRAGGIATVVAVTVICIAAIVVPRVEQSHTSAPMSKSPPIGSQLAELKGAGKYFGETVAISGTTLVVGGSGRAYVFTKTETGWRQAAELKAPNSPFGSGVSISGNTIVVSSRDRGTGVAYVFTEAAGGWKQTAKLYARRGAGVDSFVTSGTTVVLDESYGQDYVFTKTATGWTPGTELKGPNSSFDAGGPAMSISGATLLESSDIANDLREVYVFTKTAAGWKQTAGLKVDLGPPRSSDGGGGVASVAISAATAVVGVLGGNIAGRAYVYSKMATGWTQVAELQGPDTVAGADYGSSVAISGATVAVGEGTYNSVSGRAYVYSKTANGWRQVAELKGPDTVAGEGFGSPVAISGTTAVVGEGGSGGRAYVFRV
jgi:hypothetical protein